MILPNFKDFPIAGRVIGLDWGARRTGVAITDESCSFVFARKPIVSKNSDDLQSRVLSLIKEERVAGIIIGLPLRTDGTESETTKNVRDFAISLAEKIDTPICFLDETLSSLDYESSTDIITYLHEIASTMNLNIFIVSHTQLDENLFDVRIHIDKNSGFSDLTFV